MTRVALESAHIREIYDRLARGYDLRGAPLEWVLLRRFRRQLLSWAEGKILEIGIGTGRSLPHYPEECQITGVDLSPGMLKIAERRARRLDCQAELIAMDAHELMFPGGSFDTVVSNLTLCTVFDPIQVLTEMTRVAKPEGRLLLLEHGRSCHRGLSWFQDRVAPRSVRLCGCHPNRNTVALVQAADLVILKSECHLGGIIRLIHARPPRSAKVFK